jgi:hypothetical protein
MRSILCSCSLLLRYVGVVSLTFVALAPAPPVLAQVDQAACEGAAAWLQASEDRFRVFQPLFSELLIATGMTAEESIPASQEGFDQLQLDSLIGVLPEWTAAAESAVQEQVNSDPPSAAKELNNQIVVTLGSYAVGFQAMTSLLTGVIDAEAASKAESIMEDVERETDHLRELAQSLKANCELTSSGEFFSPACHGDDAVAWYTRTNMRTTDMSMALDTPQAAETIRTLRTRQESDTPPSGFEDLQAVYLSFFDEILSFLAGSTNEASAQANITNINLALESEKAQLDIACVTE